MEVSMTFATSIHCMDGRIQEATIRYVKENHSIDYLDTITEPGPCKILAENRDHILVESIVNRVNISVSKHGSRLIFISGHHDCAGNPVDETVQRKQVKSAIGFLKDRFPGTEIRGLWIDDFWKVHAL